MSFSGNKSSIFDQVNRFFTNGNNVPVKQEVDSQEHQRSNQPVSQFSTASSSADNERVLFHIQDKDYPMMDNNNNNNSENSNNNTNNNGKFSFSMDDPANDMHHLSSFNMHDGNNFQSPNFNNQELLNKSYSNNNAQIQQTNAQNGLNDQLLSYFSNSNGKIPEASSGFNEYLDSFDMNLKNVVSPTGFSNSELNMLHQISTKEEVHMNPNYLNLDVNMENNDYNNITPITSNKSFSSRNASTHKQTRKDSLELSKNSPGVSPTVDAIQPPQYTPYLQARKNRFSSITSNGKKVVKNSPTMKPSPLEKRNGYKVILPSSTSPMMLPSSIVNNNLNSGGSSSNLSKLNTSNKFSNAEDIISPQSDRRSHSVGGTPLAPTISNSSLSKLKDDNKILRATQSPVMRPLKKKASVTNLQASTLTPTDFQLDGKPSSNGPSSLKKTHSNTVYNKSVQEGYSPKSGFKVDESGNNSEINKNSKNILPDSATSNSNNAAGTTTNAPVNGSVSASGSSTTIPATDNAAAAAATTDSTVVATVGGKTKKKEVHKEAEKNRRERLNFALEDLNDLIPKEIKSSDKFPSKATTVEHAAEYIRYLVAELVKRNIEIDLTVPRETFVPKERKSSG